MKDFVIKCSARSEKRMETLNLAYLTLRFGQKMRKWQHLFNRWWNPSANDQSRDRVVRIGQRRKVRVYRFCCRGTIEEALERILKSKRELFDDAVERLAQSESAAWNRVLNEVGMERLLSESTPVAVRGFRLTAR